jgi:hypothetical protein
LCQEHVAALAERLTRVELEVSLSSPLGSHTV